MREMLIWHEKSFDALLIAGGYAAEGTGFSGNADNGIMCGQRGVVIRSRPRSRGKDDAVSYHPG
jgi:hypothetical protein